MFIGVLLFVLALIVGFLFWVFIRRLFGRVPGKEV